METVIFDCDNTLGLRAQEIDDGLALIYLLGRPEIQLRGITTTFGNGPIEVVDAQTRWLLRELEQEEIPVWKGAGQRGEISTAAAHLLAECAAEQPGELTVLATGPLGNLYAASRLDPHFFSNLRRIVCMGGILEPLQIGWQKVAELNFSADPEAAFCVLNAPCPVTVMSAQLCLQASFGWGDLRRLERWKGRWHSIIRDWLLAFGLWCGVGEFYLWDLLPAVYLSHPDLFEERWVNLTSTREDLASGKLLLGTDSARVVNLPSYLKERAVFKTCLFEAWEASLAPL